MYNISIRKIEVILAAAREKSFTRASYKENISQPAITNIIKDVEDSLGDQIFKRSGRVRRAELSEKGEKIVRVFEDIMNHYAKRMKSLHNEKATSFLKQRRAVIQQELVEFMEPSFIDTMKSCAREDNLVVVSDRLSDIREYLTKREIRLAIVEDAVSVDNADFVHLGTLNVTLCATRSRDRTNTPLASVSNIWSADPDNLVFFSGINREVHHFVQCQLEANDKVFSNYMKIESEKMFANLILSGEFVGVLPLPVAKRILPGKLVEILPLDNTDIQVAYGAMVPWGLASDIDMQVLRENPLQRSH